MKKTSVVLVAAAVATGVLGVITYMVARPRSDQLHETDPGVDQVARLQAEVIALEAAVRDEEAKNAQLEALLASMKGRRVGTSAVM